VRKPEQETDATPTYRKYSAFRCYNITDTGSRRRANTTVEPGGPAEIWNDLILYDFFDEKATTVNHVCQLVRSSSLLASGRPSAPKSGRNGVPGGRGVAGYRTRLQKGRAYASKFKFGICLSKFRIESNRVQYTSPNKHPIMRKAATSRFVVAAAVVLLLGSSSKSSSSSKSTVAAAVADDATDASNLAVGAAAGEVLLEDATNAKEVEITQDGDLVGQRRTSSTTPKQQQYGLKRVVLKYKNDQGRQDALALGKQVYHDFQDDSVLAMDLDQASLEYLREVDDNILTLQEDDLWEEQGYWEDDVAEEELGKLSSTSSSSGSSNTGTVRRLTESIPYGISMVQADQVPMGPYPVKVCIADTGGAAKHPDLSKSDLSGSNRFSTANKARLKWRQDFRGHGTHVAGTVSAIPGNDLGVRGIGKIPLHLTRALDDQGIARESDVYEAVRQCSEQSDAKIISMSLGGGGMSDAFKEHVSEQYHKHGKLIFGAAGNQGENSIKFPGGLPCVVSVAAIDEDMLRWPQSNYGAWVEMAAPGRLVLSTSVRDGKTYVYSRYSGTSMAVPHASGVAALLWSYHPDCTNTQIRYAMSATALDVNSANGDAHGAKGCDDYHGHGLIQAKAALNYLNARPCSDGWGKDIADLVGQGGCYVDKAAAYLSAAASTNQTNY